jgi:hypothetical protein
MTLWSNYLSFNCGSQSILRSYKSAARQQKQAQTPNYWAESVLAHISASGNYERPPRKVGSSPTKAGKVPSSEGTEQGLRKLGTVSANLA